MLKITPYVEKEAEPVKEVPKEIHIQLVKMADGASKVIAVDENGKHLPSSNLFEINEKGIRLFSSISSKLGFPLTPDGKLFVY